MLRIIKEKRKKYKNILCLLLFVASICLVACDNDEDVTTGEDGEISLSFWNGFTGTDGDNMAVMVNNFNKQYEGKIKVEVTHRHYY
jgi:multiple sugar transport system substrate-binding protein